MIHVERAIGRDNNYRILQVLFPITLANLASDIVSVCAYTVIVENYAHETLCAKI